MTKLWLPTDPATLPRAPRAPDIFDHAPHRNRGMQGIANDCSTKEWDDRLISTAVELGMPRVMAEQARWHPPARYHLFVIYSAVQLAAEGDKDAKEILDRQRFLWDRGRRNETISDKPAGTVGLYDR